MKLQLPKEVTAEFLVTKVLLSAGSLPEITGNVFNDKFQQVLPYLNCLDDYYDVEITMTATKTDKER